MLVLDINNINKLNIDYPDILFYNSIIWKIM